MTMDFAKGTGLCPHCGHHVAVDQLAMAEVAPEWSAVPARSSFDPAQLASYGQRVKLPDFRDKVVVLRCQFCRKNIVFLDHWEKQRPDGGGHDSLVRTKRTMIVPARPPRDLPEHTPEAARSLYAEASRCEAAVALRGAGVLYRAAVEEIVKDQGGDGRNLRDQINSLGDKLGSELISDLHESRVVGNHSIHEGLVFSEEEVADIAELIYEACHVLYAVPAERQALRAKRQARVQARKAGTVTP